MWKILVTLFFLSTLGSAAFAKTFTFGGKELSIPDPKGFVLVTPEMGAVYRLGNTTWVTQNNEIIGFYISELALPVAMEGELPSLEKTFTIMGFGDLKQIEIGTTDFLELKKEMKQMNSAKMSLIVDSASARCETRFNQEADEIFEKDVTMKFHKSIFLEPHYESENASSVSMYMKGGVSFGGDSEIPFWTAQTVTFLNVAGKILFAYCVAPKDQLEWTREASRQWTEKIIASNDPPPTRTVHERGLGWDEVQNNAIEKAITGAVTAVFILSFVGLLAALKKLFGFVKEKIRQ